MELFRVVLAGQKSPSSRRAWIEILAAPDPPIVIPVALLAEGVDRNNPPLAKRTTPRQSPSSRRAWIEIDMEDAYAEEKEHVALLAEGVDRNTLTGAGAVEAGTVALLAEGVDRNLLCRMAGFSAARRPPRGGRG